MLSKKKKLKSFGEPFGMRDKLLCICMCVCARCETRYF